MANTRWFVMTVLAAVVAVLSLRFYITALATEGPMGFHLEANPISAYIHFTLSPLALVAGAFQFSARIRHTAPAIHRVLGYIYIISCLLGAVSGLVLALFTPSGHIAAAGFALLALFWIMTTTAAFNAIRLRDITRHRRWMVRSYALTFAAVTLRLYLFLTAIAGFEDSWWAYSLIAWLCWAPNLIVAERYLLPSLQPIRPSQSPLQ